MDVECTKFVRESHPPTATGEEIEGQGGNSENEN